MILDRQVDKNIFNFNECVYNYYFKGTYINFPAIILIDLSILEGTICKLTFTSHQAWVTTVRWSTNEENLFISGSYDHQVKLWDTRR